MYFQDLVELHAPHLGEYWKTIKNEYKRVQTVAPLPPLNFSLPTLISQSLRNIQLEQFDLARTWFINADDTSLIQVQRDRIVFNWKQNHNNNPYPSYEAVIKDFKSIYGKFADFIGEAGVGAIKITGVELAYINHFVFGHELASLSRIEDVLPFFAWHSASNVAFKSIEALNWSTQFELPDNNGHLFFVVQTAQRRRDGENLLRADFIARKVAPEIAAGDAWQWFDKAHVVIVTSFADVTAPDVQQQTWERYQ